MAVVKINAIRVPEGAGAELERRFAARGKEVDGSPGFLGFQLLRPVKGEDRYFVVTQWETDEAFQAWTASNAFRSEHAKGAATPQGHPARPVATGADLLEFEVVELS